jgi:predicted dinucleotide-binding enzyme
VRTSGDGKQGTRETAAWADVVLLAVPFGAIDDVVKNALLGVLGGKVDLAPFVTRRIVVDDIVKQGFERLITHKDEEVKILVSMR